MAAWTEGARLDRIPVWSLPGLVFGIIGVGFLFTFYDIFDINVSFIQICTQIVPNCTPPSSASYIGLAVLLNLVGCAIGTLVLSPLADRAGRRDLLLVTMVITGLGSVLTAVVDNYAWFVAARTITGVGIGADLWLGLWLTTPATPLPMGLPFAIAGPGFEYGWRIMYLIGGALALIGVLLRFQLPESARWLIARGQLQQAATVIDTMEHRASARVSLAPVERPVVVCVGDLRTLPYTVILGDPMSLGRSRLDPESMARAAALRGEA